MHEIIVKLNLFGNLISDYTLVDSKAVKDDLNAINLNNYYQHFEEYPVRSIEFILRDWLRNATEEKGSQRTLQMRYFKIV